MRHFKWMVLLPLMALSAGCATLNENECRTIDWTELGRSDGAKGYESSRLGDHMEACGKFGIAPNGDAYRAGREEGLHQYCTPENALQLGTNGSGYHQVCPGEVGEMFSRVYARGAALHTMQSEMQDVQTRRDSEQAAQRKVKDLDLYKQLEQNVRYLDRKRDFMQRQYDQASRDISAGFDPQHFNSGDWQNDIPYPQAAHDAEKRAKESNNK